MVLHDVSESYLDRADCPVKDGAIDSAATGERSSIKARGSKSWS